MIAFLRRLFFMRHKVRFNFIDPYVHANQLDGALGWLIDNVGEMGIDWDDTAGLNTRLVCFHHTYHFRREDDKFKFILTFVE